MSVNSKTFQGIVSVIASIAMSLPAHGFFQPLDGLPIDVGQEPIFLEDEQPPQTDSGLLSTDQVDDVESVKEWLRKYAETEGLVELEESLVHGLNLPRRFGAGDRRVLLRNQIANQPVGQQLYRVLTSITKSNSACSNFVGSSGVGSVGRKILSEVDQFSLVFRGTDDLKQYCPKYDRLSNDNRKHVWLMAMTVMSFLESTCRANAQARGPNGTLIGLFQLHKGKESQYTRSRRCARNGGGNPDMAVICTLGMLDDQIARKGQLFSRDSYWGVLRPQGEPKPGARGQRIVKNRIIQDALVSLPICH